jgi:hypothetical protein
MLFKLFLSLFPVVLLSISAIGQNSKQQELLAQIKLMDRQWIIEAYSSRDLKEFDRIVADDFLITAGNGKVLTKGEKRASVARDYTDSQTSASPDYVFRIDTDSHKVRIFDHTAVSNGFIIEKYVWKGQKVDNRVYFTNVYVRRGKGWQVVASQFTNIKPA